MFTTIDPSFTASFATDAAPVERAQLEKLFLEVIKQSQSAQLGEDLEYAALSYAQEVADHAFTVGYRLGKEEGHVSTLRSRKEEEAAGPDML